MIAQKNLLQIASSTLQETQSTLNRRLYCLGSDGDAKRRRAMILLAFLRPVATSSPLYESLSGLRLFNTMSGEDDITMDFDWKHVLKRFRNTLLRQKGIMIESVVVTSAIIKLHLVKNGMAESTAEAILNPNDRQDVTLMIQLLNSLSQLRNTSPGDNSMMSTSHHTLILIGRLYRHLLETYLNPSLSLRQQLIHLSAAAHLTLALYASNKGDFIPVQLYFDVMSMIKNVYFCVAKTQNDNPKGSFWIILLGTDGLEKTFGHVRTMVGNDTNADHLQLTNRIDGAVQCVRILEEHPEWGGESRRLTVRTLEEQGSDISRNMDHINPKSWVGNVLVRGISLKNCWEEGRAVGENDLEEAFITSPFSRMDDGEGFDIMAPFGSNRVILINGRTTGEDEEAADELEPQSTPPTPNETPSPAAPSSSEEFEPDLDDLADTEEAIHSNIDSSKPTYDAWVPVGNSTKRQHKSTILRFYSSPLTVAQSKDRLKRVRGYSQFDEQSTTSLAAGSSTDEGNYISVEDPVLTLVQCNDLIFLAVIKVLDIRIGISSEETIAESLLHDPNTHIRGQIMNLSLTDKNHQPDGPDWEWNGILESTGAMGGLRDIEGSRIDLIDAETQRRTKGRNIGSTTYAFRSQDLRAATAVLRERLLKILHRLPIVEATDSFPYRSEKGIHLHLTVTLILIVTSVKFLDAACFICEGEASVQQQKTNQSCRQCITVSIAKMSGPELIRHNGAHILNDPNLKGAKNLCGFCLSADHTCSIRIIKRAKVGDVLDLANSRCPNLKFFSITSAKVFSKKSPCTNVPLTCPYCTTRGSDAVWKYNLRAHILDTHPMADINIHLPLFHISTEETTLMTAVYRRPPKNKGKKKATRVLAISKNHSSRLALE